MKHRVTQVRPTPRARTSLRRHRGTAAGEASSDSGTPDLPPPEPAPEPSAPALTGHAAEYEWLSAFDELEDPVIVHDAHFRILRCNPAYAAYAGQPMAAILGKPYWQVFPKLTEPLGSCAEAMAGTVTTEKSELTTANGQVFANHDITAHRPNGEFWYSRHLMENMTARRRSEDADRRRSMLAEAVFRSMPGALVVVDRNGRMIRWSTGFPALAGRPDATLHDADLVSLVTESERPTLTAKLDEAAHSGQSEGELRLLNATGGIEHCLFSARKVTADNDYYVACLCFGKSVIERLEHDLAREKSVSDTVIESAPGPYYVVDQSGRLVRWNQRMRDVTGLNDSQLIGTPVLDTIVEEDRPLAAAKLLLAAATGFAQMEVRMPTATQGVRTFLKTARRFEIDGVPYVTGFCVDVTQHREAQDAMAKEKAFMAALIESVPGAFYVIDREGNYYAWNSYLNRLTGLPDSELRQRSSLMTVTEEDRPLTATTMRQALDTGYAQADVHVQTRDRGVRLYFTTMRRFQVNGMSYLVGVGMDTTDRGARIEKLEEEARTDPLTQLANRAHFLALAAQEFARSRRYGHPLSLWMLDVDFFKQVNDTHGHHAGDLALKALASISRQMLRDWDIMGRMGGEEFAVLLPETDSAQALLVAERLRQKVATTNVPLDHEAPIHLTISIGVATIRADDGDVEGLLERADQALLEAKRTGRDKVSVAEVRQDDIPDVHEDMPAR